MKEDFKKLILDSREELSTISRKLDKVTFPLSTAPELKFTWQLAHAISAIKLAQCILRDIDTEG